MEVAICDDNSAYVDILYDYVCKYAYENNIDINIKKYESGIKLINSDDKYDVILLDIDMPFLDGMADRAPLDIRFAICKRYFFGNNGIAVLEISCKIEGGSNHPCAVLTDIAIFACFFILIGGKPFGKPHSPSGILFGNAPVFIEVQLHIFHPAGCNLLRNLRGNDAVAAVIQIFPRYDGFQLFARGINQDNLAAFFLCKGFHFIDSSNQLSDDSFC